MNTENERPNASDTKDDTEENIKYALELCEPNNVDEATVYIDLYRTYTFLKKCLIGVPFLEGLEERAFEIPKAFLEYIIQSSEQESDLEVQQTWEHTCKTGRYKVVPLTLETFEVLILRYGRDGDGLNTTKQRLLHKSSYEYVLVVQLRNIFDTIGRIWRDENETEMTVTEPDKTSLILEQINKRSWMILGEWEDGTWKDGLWRKGKWLKLMHQLRGAGFKPIPIRVITIQEEELKSYLYLFLPREEIGNLKSYISLPDDKIHISFLDNRLTVYGKDLEDSYEPLFDLESNNLSQKDLVDAIETHVLHTFGSKTHVTAIEELTKVPLHCSHTLSYPYARRYAFIEHSEVWDSDKC